MPFRFEMGRGNLCALIVGFEAKMNVLIVDDHSLFRSGLRYLLSDLNESISFLESDGIEQIVLPGPDYPIDLVLLDLNLRGSSGLSALQSIKDMLADTTVVVLSSEESPDLIRQVIDAGASGFIPKSSTPEVLVHALRLILHGGTYLPPNVLGDYQPQIHLGNDFTNPASAEGAGDTGHALAEKISPRQLDSLLLAVKGKSNKVIARELGIAEGTVKLHLSAAYRALGVSNRTEAVFAVAEQGRPAD